MMGVGRKALGKRSLPEPARQVYHWVNTNSGRLDARHRSLPNFLVVGAQRSGTTSLFLYLLEHPLVFGPRRAKGVHYFDTGFDRSIEWYRAHFPRRATLARLAAETGATPAVGEGAPYYLFHPTIPERIAALIPDCRILIVLREPLDRAVSHHAHEVRRGFEALPLTEAFEAEGDRLAGEEERLIADPTYVSRAHIHHAYIGRGRYAGQVERYLDRFGPDRVLVLDSAALKRDPAAVVQEATDFLGLDPIAGTTYPLYNQRERDPVDAELRARFGSRFAESNARLRELVPGRLSWL